MKIFCVAILLLTFPCLAWAGLEEGLAAYERGDFAAALLELRPLALKGASEAQLRLGMMYYNGHGVQRDYVEAVKWYRKAAEQGSSLAQYNLGLMYQKGQGVPKSLSEAVRWFRKAAEQGNSAAQFYLGFMYEEGQGIPKDLTEAARWFRRAAEQGYSDAQFYLGRKYQEGQGVPKDYTEAVKWYGKAAEQEDSRAQVILGALFFSGEGVRKDVRKAVKWFRKAAEREEVGAQYILGLMYYNGKGVSRDYDEAARWLRKASEQGNSSAQYMLGLMYYKAQGVALDYAEAARWYRKAAEQGNGNAQFDLGLMYYNGEGVLQDYAEAARWYRKAAEQGNSGAMNNLGVMYKNGFGVSQDLVLSYVWLNLAATHAEPGSDRDQSVSNRDEVARQLSAQQLARAQQMSREMDRGLGSSADAAGLQLTEKSLAPPAPSLRILKIQEALTALGYDPGPVDGLLGSRTRTAIRAFQADYDLPVTGEPSDGLEAELFAERSRSAEAGPGQLQKHTTGSGFFVSGEGHILTNNHVVEGCREIRIAPDGIAEVVARDPQNDLALLKISQKSARYATFREGRGIRPGDHVVVVGFPMPGVLASDLNITTGTVSALAGPGDDRSLLQITAPVQPGNSGGPLLDLSGNIVGAVVGKMDALKVARLTGDIPQNVNFALSAGVVRTFLDAYSVPYETASSARALAPADVVARAREFTVLIECWK